MKFLHFLTLCCSSAVGAAASEEMEVRGRVGGHVSIRCSDSWMTTNGSSEHDSIYFCKGVCFGGNTLIKAERRAFSLTRRGRYSVEIGGTREVFSVTLQELSRADAGQYHCGVGTSFKVLHQQPISLIILEAPTVPPGSPPSSTSTLQTPADTTPEGGSPSSAAASPAASTLSPSEEKRRQKGATKLTGTTVVIIVSGSLASLVCAIIPLIFYGHWRSNSDDQSRREGSKVSLQAVEPQVESESDAHDATQYAAIYQALDPKALD